MYKENRHIEGINIEDKINQSLEVPSGYFSDLQDLLEERAKEETSKQASVIPIWLKVAAVAITCCLSIWLLKNSETDNTSQTEYATNEVTWEDYDEFVGINTDDLVLLSDFDDTLTELEQEVLHQN